jgi:hypothetical protein
VVPARRDLPPPVQHGLDRVVPPRLRDSVARLELIPHHPREGSVTGRRCTPGQQEPGHYGCERNSLGCGGYEDWQVAFNVGHRDDERVEVYGVPAR